MQAAITKPGIMSLFGYAYPRLKSSFEVFSHPSWPFEQHCELEVIMAPLVFAELGNALPEKDTATINSSEGEVGFDAVHLPLNVIYMHT